MRNNKISFLLISIIFFIGIIFFLSGCTHKNLEKNSLHTGKFINDVVVIAHVGVPKEATYNSLEGFLLAKAYGADGIEFDVSMTKDNKTVVMHGPDIENSTICNHKKKNITDYTLLELKEDCTLNNKEPIRTLDEMLNEIKDLFDYYFIEIKVHNPDQRRQQLFQTIKSIQNFHLQKKAIIISYDQELLKQAAKELVLIGRDTYTPQEFTTMRQSTYPYFLADYTILTPEIIQFVQQKTDKELVAYTTVTIDQFKSVYDKGIRFIMTDNIKDTMQYVIFGKENN